MTEYLAHHGQKGQRWGERRYQNLDGSLTPLGRIWYGVGPARKKAKAQVNELDKTRSKRSSGRYKTGSNKETAEQMMNRLRNDPGYKEVIDKKNGGKVLVKIEDPKKAEISLSYLGYTKEEISQILGKSSAKSVGVSGSKSDSKSIGIVGPPKNVKYVAKGHKPSEQEVQEILDLKDKRLAQVKLHNLGYSKSQQATLLGISTKDDGKPSGAYKDWSSKYKVNKNDRASLRARQTRARSLKSSGKTIAEIADIMGESVDWVKDYLYEDFGK